MSHSWWPPCQGDIMPGSPVPHRLPEFAQVCIHWIGDAIQPSHPVTPFSSCLQSFPASEPFHWVCFSHQVAQSIGAFASASVLPTNIHFDLSVDTTIRNHHRLMPSNSSVKTFVFFSVEKLILIIRQAI